MGSINKPIVLPCLRKIEIWDLDGALVHKLFDSLRAPLLEVANIFALPSRSTLGALFGCLEQSSSVTVTSLELSECEISVEELLRLSRLAPDLQELDVQMLSTDVVQALEATPTGDNIFPHLTMLIIRQFRVDIRMLFKVCVSRCYPDDLGHVVRPVRQLARCCICSLEEEVSRSLHNMFEDFEEDGVFQEIIERIDATLQRIANLAGDSEDEDYESDGAFGTSSAESHATEIQIPLQMFEELERCLDFLEPYQVTHALLLVRHNVEDILEKFHEISEYHAAQTAPLVQFEQSNPNRLYLRAMAILDRWRPLIAEYTAGNMRWVDGKDGCDWYGLVHCPQGKTRVKASATGMTPGGHAACNVSLAPCGP
ncbi:hypothetical protein BD779DRAFT_1553489 [Infundibulicybe gibba]|nr:hypothetical protein BD779DRAFT_1553489 [Infundibulicybe gibba]